MAVVSLLPLTHRLPSPVKHIVTGGDDGTVRLWDVEPGKTLQTFSGHTARAWAVALSNDGKQHPLTKQPSNITNIPSPGHRRRPGTNSPWCPRVE
jgi:WD40 repeat protein